MISFICGYSVLRHQRSTFVHGYNIFIFLGWLVDSTGTYQMAFTVLGAAGAASLALACIVFCLTRNSKNADLSEVHVCVSSETVTTQL